MPAARSNAGAPNERLVAGAMSGTSADGVDVALTRIQGHGLDMTAHLVRHHHRAYDADLRAEIFAFRAGEVRENPLPRLAQLARNISLTYALAVNETLTAEQIGSRDLAAVAAHGQTLFHDPPTTIQWLDPSLIAAEVGCDVVSDFRRADLAAGGQGAPLVPFADYILFRDPAKHRVLLNIGGIANLTYLRAGGKVEELIAFDTGPGNCLSDSLMRRIDPGGAGYDRDGERASSGNPVPAIVNEVLAADYFRRKPPKSTDGPEMIALFNAAVARAGNVAASDLLASAGAITARAIAAAISQFPQPPDEILASGGGVHNRCIMDALRQQTRARVMLADDFGVPGDAKEAVAFALLGAATLDRIPSNFPSATGAKRGVVLGSITPKPDQG